MAIKRKYIGELLIDMGMITQEQLDECLKEAERVPVRGSARSCASRATSPEQQLMEIMEFQLGIPLVNLDAVAFSQSLAKHVPMTLAKKHKILPVKAEGGKLYVAMSDPLDFIAIEDAKMVSGLEVMPMITSEQAIETGINKVYGSEYAESAIKELAEEGEGGEEIDEGENAKISDAPIVRLVTSIFEQAAKARASDIHVEPGEDRRARTRAHRRAADYTADHSQARAVRRDYAPQDYRQHGHRGKAHPAGRPIQACRGR